MSENKLADLSMDFAVKILSISDNIQGHYSLKNQLERSATSIGANIREAKYAQSRADFISKLQIALKECYETEYWLELLLRANILPDNGIKELMLRANILPDNGIKELMHDSGVIRRMLISSINTTKENML